MAIGEAKRKPLLMAAGKTPSRVIPIKTDQYRSLIISRRPMVRAENLAPPQRGLVDQETGELYLLSSDP
jgi:hypothetical protein